MLLRDAQEEARVLYAALRGRAGGGTDPLVLHVAETLATLAVLQRTGPESWRETCAQRERAVGVMLLVSLGVAQELEVDSLEALRSVLLQESP